MYNSPSYIYCCKPARYYGKPYRYESITIDEFYGCYFISYTGV